jgi:Bacterial SH3 domain
MKRRIDMFKHILRDFLVEPKWLFRSGMILILMLLPQFQAFCQSYLGHTTRTVNLREGPGTGYKAIAQIEQGEQVFVISKDPTNDFVNVIYIKTAEEGWIHKNFIVIKSEVPRSSERIFTPEARISSKNPEIEVYNNTSLTLTLNLNNKNYIFEPQERKTLTLYPGKYDYRASAPGVIPYYGKDDLDSNYRYSWEFYIVTRRRP